MGVELAALLGAAVGVGAVIAWQQFRPRPAVPPAPTVAVEEESGLPPGLLEAALGALTAGVVLVNEDDDVLLANAAAEAMGATRRSRLASTSLNQMVREARSEDALVETEIELAGERDPMTLQVQATALSEYGVVVLRLTDTTESKRVDAVRRDFVANVSHELKTPVGALSLLAEAVLEAAADPADVRRFAERMKHESERLARLVQELIDLSRLQGADPTPQPVAVRVPTVLREATDRVRLAAENKRIELAVGDTADLMVWGDADQLVTAVGNLLDNAVAYSSQDTRVGVGARRAGDLVEISVTDQGIGISPDDLERIFERFYRADPARSRATGGTGLGLAIVKHIATNHGGRVTVWSSEGSGSTFTLHLPAVPSEEVGAA